MSALAFILPPLFFLRLSSSNYYDGHGAPLGCGGAGDSAANAAQLRRDRLAAWAILVFGVLGMIVCSTISIINLVAKLSAGTDQHSHSSC